MLNFAKLLSFTALILAFSPIAFADSVIELDHQNADHCIQQLSSTQDNFPVILIYATHCPFAQMFLPTYTEFAKSKSQQGRAYFEFDFDNSPRDVSDKCLGISTNAILASPTVTVIYQVTDPDSGKSVRSMPLRAWGGTKADPTDPSKFVSISPKELEHIVNLDGNENLVRAQMFKEVLAKKLSQ